MPAQANSRISPAKLALAVQRLRAEKENLALIQSDPIAIIGMGCRFPGGAVSPDEFWTALREGRDCVGEISPGRWKDASNLPRHLRFGAYLAEVDGFDAAYFGISPREAQHMDPQQRLLLEVVWEALWDSGIEPNTMGGADAGVFAAIYNNDYARLDFRDPSILTAHAGVGSAHSVAAGRLSFLLNIKGPSLALDSACSSSLVAMHLACQSLRSQECGLAIVAASSLKLLSDEVQVFSKWGMLAADGRCKTFDASADGFGPGEGGGALVLKRLSDALQDGDRIHAVIRGTAVNHDGRTTVLTAPNSLAQEAVLRAALKNAMLEPSEVGYVETHGTGTPLGDPIEIEAVSSVYGHISPDAPPCVLGAVKTNLGHLEAAAGLAGMIKTVLSLEHGEIPRNLHFERLNPEISLTGTRLKIATENIPWKRGGQARVAGISSFGLGGTNGHVLVEEAPLLPLRESRMIPLPACQWQRKKYWLAEPASTLTAVFPAARISQTRQRSVHPLLACVVDSPFVKGKLFESDLNTVAVSYLSEHGLSEQPLVPFAAFLEATAAAVRESGSSRQNCSIRNFLMREPLFVSSGDCRLQTLAGEDSVEVASKSGSGWTVHARGSFGNSTAPAGSFDLENLKSGCKRQISPEAIYCGLERTGLRYGPAFRTIRSVWAGEGQALAHLQLAEELRGEAIGYGLHPTLLDGCLQTVMAARAATGDDLFLPISVDRFDLHRAGVTELWAYTKMTASSPETFSADIVIADVSGHIVARLSGFTAKRTSPEVRKANSGNADLLYEPAWRAAPLEASSGIRSGDRLLLIEACAGACSALAAALTEKGASCEVVRAEEFRSALSSKTPWTGIVFDKRKAAPAAASPEWNHPEKNAVEFVLEFAKSLAATPAAPPKLWVISSSAVSVLPSEDISLAQAPLRGMLRTLALEHPETSPVLIDAGLSNEQESNVQLVEEIAGAAAEPIVAIRHGTRYVARLIHPALRENPPERLQFAASGRLEDLRLEPAERRTPEPDEVEIEVRAAGLNFRDVLTALGMLPARTATPGAECAGTIVRVGSEVKGWNIGDDVLAFAPASFQNFVTVPADFVALKPASMTFEDAAGIPVAFLTALYGFEKLARLSAGQNILIHAAAGGLGMAAVRLAMQTGAEVFATVGSPEKRRFLQRLGVRHIFDSRSLAFREEVLNATDGRGVDVVLNSLSGEFIQASFDVTAQDGCFLEVGKRGLWNAEEVAALGKNIRYFPFDLGDVAREQPTLITEMFRELMKRFSSGELESLPTELYSFDDSNSAFRTMAQARHIGKIVLGMHGHEPRATVRDLVGDGTVLITGGLGALGIETARWLAAHEARNIILAARSVSENHHIVAELEAQGVEVGLERVDITNAQTLNQLLEKIRATRPPLCAVFHAAGVVQDSVLGKETWDTYRTAIAPKIDGAWNLDRLTSNDPVRLMVFFSSAASILGSPGQGSYAAGNAFLDALAQHRSSRGMRTLSVNWGPWASAGMAARRTPEQAARWMRQGATPMDPAAALSALGAAIESGRTQVAVIGMEWEKFLGEGSGRRDQAIFQELRKTQSRPATQACAKPADGILDQIRSAPAADRKAIVSSHVKVCARRVLGLDAAAAIGDNVPLQDVGLDSLMALEMRNELAQSLGVTLTAGLLFDYPSVDQLTPHLLAQLAESKLASSTPETALDALTDDEAEQLLMEELDRLGREKVHA